MATYIGDRMTTKQRELTKEFLEKINAVKPLAGASVITASQNESETAIEFSISTLGDARFMPFLCAQIMLSVQSYMNEKAGETEQLSMKDFYGYVFNTAVEGVRTKEVQVTPAIEKEVADLIAEADKEARGA